MHKFGHVAELLITFGLSYIILELVQLVWGRIGAVDFKPPESLRGPVFTLVDHAGDGLRLAAGSGAGRSRAAAPTPTVRVVCTHVSRCTAPS